MVSTQTLATTSTVTTTTMARFEPVDGGVGRACRGSSSSDNSAQYFDVAWRIGPACRESLAPHGATSGDETHHSWKQLEANHFQHTSAHISTQNYQKIQKDGSSYCTVVVYQPSPWFFCRLNSCVSQVVSVPTLDECKELCTMKQEPPKPTASNRAVTLQVTPAWCSQNYTIKIVKIHQRYRTKQWGSPDFQCKFAIIHLFTKPSRLWTCWFPDPRHVPFNVRSAWAWSTVGVAVSCGRDQKALKRRFPWRLCGTEMMVEE